ncbi:MAG TPA: hypothetical protein VMF03_15280 [Steroidobacteraceae bacterium]|nr:hypothetical protein [Steroidobacteraceae bacterium]
MSRGGKGKLPNDLIAASCAAVLAVYAAGYSRTRDAAKRLETHAQEPRLTVQTQRARTIAAQSDVAITRLAVAPPEPALPDSPAEVARPRRRHHRSSSATVGAADTRVAAAAPDPAPGAPPAIAPVPLPTESADPSAPAVTASEGPALPEAKWRDGVYTGTGDSAHGDIEARVVIKGGRIVEAGISACGTRYPCSVIDSILQQPVERQSAKVDYVSHATESSYAYYFALDEALKAALVHDPGETTDPR